MGTESGGTFLMITNRLLSRCILLQDQLLDGKNQMMKGKWNVGFNRPVKKPKTEN